MGWSDLNLPTPMFQLGEKHEVGKMWLWHWHRFIDHLADGKTAEKFFATLAELQLERERLLTAFRESASVFFREHDLKPWCIN